MAEKLIAELGWVSHFYDRDVEAILKQRCEKDDVDTIPTLLNRSMQFLHDNKSTSYWHLVHFMLMCGACARNTSTLGDDQDSLIPECYQIYLAEASTYSQFCQNLKTKATFISEQEIDQCMQGGGALARLQ